MRLWIDLANSPHVLFFTPILRDLKQQGVECLVTAREFAQTVGLARLHEISHVVVGGHGGSGWGGKAANLWTRALSLVRVVRRFQPHLALSHNAYSALIAARLLRVPSLTFMDYEDTPANHLAFRLAGTVVVPEAIPLRSIRKFGANRRKVRTYPGFKEQLYLDGFRSTPEALIPELTDAECASRVLIVARPPADFAVYHRFANPLFDEWLQQVGNRADALVVVLPRTAAQLRRTRSFQLPSVRVPSRALPGPELLARADLVVSAGGTMNREAAVLGVPAYSLFAGVPPAVDRELARLGRLRLIRDREDLPSIRLEKKPKAFPMSGVEVRTRIMEIVQESHSKGSKSLVLGRA